jgi:hypothetical protein
MVSFLFCIFLLSLARRKIQSIGWLANANVLTLCNCLYRNRNYHIYTLYIQNMYVRYVCHRTLSIMSRYMCSDGPTGSHCGRLSPILLYIWKNYDYEMSLWVRSSKFETKPICTTGISTQICIF